MRLSLLLTVLLAGCASISARQPSSEEMDAVRVAEEFVVRNGYTSLGHPAGLPVQRVSIFDVLASDEELVKERKGLLEPHAVAVEEVGPAIFWVYFPESGSKDSPRIVYVKNGQAAQLFHQSYGMPGRKAKPVLPSAF